MPDCDSSRQGEATRVIEWGVMAIPGNLKLTMCVVLPAHNEADHIASVIARIPEWVDRIVVD